MPQVRIEFSGNLKGSFDQRALALKIHGHLTSIAAADLASCKTGFIHLDEIVIADGSGDQGMIHIAVGILSGRTDEQKRELGTALMQDLEQAFRRPDGMEVQLTVEIRDMDRDFYRKVRLP